ncbi:MAG: putative secondary metabolism biosynthetic enzyme [Alyxoria varia]|nr:MAG: putative secondary metabolism biosynthetic enzyme [Alyxoria varia]
MSGTTYLITGANRGLGLGFVEHYAAKPHNTVIATVRDVAKSQEALDKVKKADGSKIIVVKIDSTSTTDPKHAVEELKTKHGITAVDVIIANAGFAEAIPLDKIHSDTLVLNVKTHAIGPVLLYQAFLPLLEASKQQAKFCLISTSFGSKGEMETYNLPFNGYGSSKAMANHLVRRMHFECQWLCSFSIHPGWVQTELGNSGAHMVGMEKAFLTVEESVAKVSDAVDNSTRAEHSGKFFNETKDVIFPW